MFGGIFCSGHCYPTLRINVISQNLPIQISIPGRGTKSFLFYKTFETGCEVFPVFLYSVEKGAVNPGCEVYHSHPSSAEVNKEWSYTFVAPPVFVAYIGAAVGRDSSVQLF